MEDFGPPPIGPYWLMDHCQGETLHLGDGYWHHMISYRNINRGEHAAGTPTPWTEQYLEEVISGGISQPVCGDLNEGDQKDNGKKDNTK